MFLSQAKRTKSKEKNKLAGHMLDSIVADGSVTLEEFTALMKVLVHCTTVSLLYLRPQAQMLCVDLDTTDRKDTTGNVNEVEFI